MNEETYTSIVRGIIEEEISEGRTPSKFYIIEEIKNRFTPIYLFNRAIKTGRVKDVTSDGNGLGNLAIGAKAVFRDAMRNLRRDFLIKKGFIFHKPKSVKGSKAKLYTYGNETKSLSEWAKDKGITKDALVKRLQEGWSLEEALLTPHRMYRQPRISSPRQKYHNLVVEIVGPGWAEMDVVKELFMPHVNKEEALQLHASRSEAKKRLYEKKPNTQHPRNARTLSEEKKIAAGASEMFQRVKDYLIRKGVVEVRDGLIRKVK